MSREHTKEPWRVAQGYIASAANVILPHDNWEANARRIVACVNYCEGVSTAELEAAPKNVNLRAILNTIDSAAAREELVALLARVKP